MPAYNHEQFVGEATDSVLVQTCADLELIVIDDGSTDRTGDIVRSFDDRRVNYFHQENQDAFNALNRGLSLAKGEFVAILNSDDAYEPGRLQRLLDAQRESGDVCLFTDLTPVDADGAPLKPDHPWRAWHQRNRDFYHQTDGDLYRTFLRANVMVTTSNLFMTRQALENVGNFCSLRYLHDYDFIFRMLLAYPGQVRYLDDEKLLQYRLHGSNTISEAAITGREQDRDLIRKYLLAQCPEAVQARIDTGINRLIELEHELIEVRRELSPNAATPVPPPPPPPASIPRRIAHKLRNLVR